MASTLPHSPMQPDSSCDQQEKPKPHVVDLQPYPVVVPEYQPTNVTSQAITVRPPGAFILGGRCPACHIGTIEEGFTCLGVWCGICMFPLGLLCCLFIRRYRCADCGASAGDMVFSKMMRSPYKVVLLIAFILLTSFLIRLWLFSQKDTSEINDDH